MTITREYQLAIRNGGKNRQGPTVGGVWEDSPCLCGEQGGPFEDGLSAEPSMVERASLESRGQYKGPEAGMSSAWSRNQKRPAYRLDKLQGDK